MVIETPRLKLLPCTVQILQSAIEGKDKLEEYLEIKVEDDWTEFGIEPLKFSLHKLQCDIEENGWLTYFPIHIKDKIMMGSGGYKGKPNPKGTVEIGYEIAPAYRQKGLATEMAKGLISNALKDERVKTIIAHTLSEENPSTKILKKCGFVKADEIFDPEDGLIWKWELHL